MTEKDTKGLFESPLLSAFTRQFGGQFLFKAVSGILFYSGRDDKAYELGMTKTDFYAVISRSIKEKKNLLLQLPTFTISE
jgi:hypothetical protein